MKQVLKLSIDMQSFWHIGSGEEGGAYADALTLKSAQSLPYIPGKSLKGRLRDAFELAAQNGWFSAEFTTVLFGQEGEALNTAGLIRVSSATLSNEESQYIVQNQGQSLLYRTLQSTAIDSKTGTAKDGSLRAIEVALPMTLTAHISLNQSHPLYDAQQHSHYLTALAQASKLINSLGAKRTRGLGECSFTAQLEEQA
ncbi:RAMP superfamily CRISPR-associated protein [Paraferrimonas haliotis]|uniref:RAMP superfamily CRISPR-associated protein n=1 Tax=Paraferrimonas haliotis TaxID=2013866 RepID=UPI000BA969CF|nr:RAMP superfamily CRISPR-associated protein [Paraferrimonas haliotis]